MNKAKPISDEQLFELFRDAYPSDEMLPRTAVETEGDQVLREILASDRGGHHRPRRFHGLRWVARPRASAKILIGFALVAAGAAVVALLLVPGSGSSSYLARAAAAITSPGPDTVLYERWQTTAAGQSSPSAQPDQLWVEGAAPRHYRLILQPNSAADVAPGAGIWSVYGGSFGFGGYPYWLEELEAAVAGHPLELGGELENPREHAQPPRTVTFTPPNTLWRGRLRAPLGVPLPGGPDQTYGTDADPVSTLREAINEGHAHESGTEELDGKVVERITFAAASGSQSSQGSENYALVEAETFKPVKIVFGDTTYQFLAYEYLPATSANLARANIHAQHPNAQIIPDTPPSRSTTDGSLEADGDHLPGEASPSSKTPSLASEAFKLLERPRPGPRSTR